VAGEACVRAVYDSCLNALDVETARAAKWGGMEAVLSSKIEGTQAIPGELLKFEAGEAGNGIKSMTGQRLREDVIRAPARL